MFKQLQFPLLFAVWYNILSYYLFTEDREDCHDKNRKRKQKIVSFQRIAIVFVILILISF